MPDVADLAYEAATGLVPWHAVGLALKGLVGANTATLWAGDPAAGRVEMLYAENIPAEAERAYAVRYYAQDPFVAGYAEYMARNPVGPEPRVLAGPLYLDYEAYRRSEFYAEFGRGIGLYHIIGSVLPLGDAGIMPLGLHRPERASPFTEADRAALEAVFPHLRRAVRLQYRLREAGLRAREALAAAALQTLPLAVLVVDRSLRVTYANPAAEALGREGIGLRIARSGPPSSPASIGAESPGETAALLRMVRAVAARQVSGGGLRLNGGGEGGVPASVAVLVTALPPGLEASLNGRTSHNAFSGQVLVMARPLGGARGPVASVLCDLFGLSPAEAQVALALAGGVSTEAAAAARGVGPATVRSQVRVILEKTGAANLRELERLLGLLAGY
ncbi:helix-turn-helix transcriptional regulator [Roseomonas populi]|uniref:HTH luxR-type domain-containing protein n=1 Tax=Roseomonas populi TaxID=3121582 RepID=A0ABT1X0A6_9PROT|nr:hypothetical protein [Roseomonas pecuniae]MCR0981537.1 hypothetical protein [Roseomonas pecuniae]